VQSEAVGFINDQIDAVNAEIAIITTFLTSPGNLAQALSWIQNFINMLTAGQASMMAQLLAYQAKLVEIMNSITSKSSSLNCI
jgi:cob(I)alamin adenosyltransferase